jgi:hypothetical protein
VRHAANTPEQEKAMKIRQPITRGQGRALALKTSIVALVAAAAVGGTAGIAQAKPSASCSQLKERMITSAYYAEEAGTNGWDELADWWLDVNLIASDAYFGNCLG